MKYEDIELLEIPPETFVRTYPIWTNNLVHIASPIDINIPSSKEILFEMVNSVQLKSDKIRIYSKNRIHHLYDNVQIPFVSLKYSTAEEAQDLIKILSEILKYKLLIWSPNKIKKEYLGDQPRWLRLPIIYRSANYNNIEITKIKI